MMQEERDSTHAPLPSTRPSTERGVSRLPNESMPRGVVTWNESLAKRLFWFLAILSGLLLVRYSVPYFANQVSYAIALGRQRAEVEVATGTLERVQLHQLSKAYELISKRVGPSVVHIQVLSLEQLPGDEFASIYGYTHRQTQGQGSGIIIDKNGYVLTSNHVVRGATRIEAVLSDGRRVSATVIGRDPAYDLALLKIAADNLIAAEWGNSDQLDVGGMVWALGSPFGLQRSITFGILSAKGRETGKLDLLQTDAAVNPGNSGGPLVDALGRIVGINTAIVGESYRGISFAIPSTTAQRIYRQLRDRGRVDRGWLGVDLDPRHDQVGNGARVRAIVVIPGHPSPAQQAGLRAGDIIVRWNDQPVNDLTALPRLVAATEVGARVMVVAIRRGQQVSLEVVVGRSPEELD